MHKFTKISVSFLLILSIILNPFASAFNIKASAFNPALIGEFILFLIEQGAKGYIIGQTALIAADASNEAIQAKELAEWHQQNALDSFEQGVGVSLDETGCFITATRLTNSDLTEEEAEFADFFTNYINSNPHLFTLTYNPITGYPEITIDDYERIKSAVTNAYNEYTSKKIAEQTRLQSLKNLTDAGIFPVYDFNFVGPQPSYMFPTSTGTSHINRSGFIYTPPISSSLYNEKSKLSTDCSSTYSSGLDNVLVSGNDASGYQFTGTFTGYSGGEYIVYNGNIYYKQTYSYTSDSHTRTVSSRLIPSSSFGNFYASDGTCLADVYTTGSYSQGFFYNLTGEVQAGKPTVDVLEDDFNVTTGGGSVEIPRTDDEELLGQALGLGLINPDSALEINEDGSVSTADGMTLAKLQELIDLIASGQLSFENIQEYLDLITKLVASGNLTDTQQKTILENIKELEKVQADELTAIKDMISSITDTSDVAVDTDFDIDTPDTIIDKFPFCLPFDVYTLFNLLSAQPEAPYFDIPLKMDGVFDFNISIDLSEFDAIANIFRWFMYIIFILGLILATNKLIGRG